MLRIQSIDEQTKALADVYDSLIAPKEIHRNNNNKLYLILKAYAAGNVGLLNAILALYNRFDPALCDDIDLYSVAKIVGTDFKRGTGSILRITATNASTAENVMLCAGRYNYLSASGMVFFFDVANDILFLPGQSNLFMASSQEEGEFLVEDNASINLFRSDNAVIDGPFDFSCEGNSDSLGYADELPFDFRTRILKDADRQDSIKELELKIRNLKDILECTIVINEDISPQEYDGIMLAGKELLISVTGVPTDEMARIVAGEVLYATHQVDPDNVVYYYNDLFLSGRYPVYFKFHGTTDFSLGITYQYDSSKLRTEQIEDAIKILFKPYTRMTRHLDLFGEGDAYKVLENLNLPNVKILNIDILDDVNGTLEDVSFVKIPKTRLLHLTEIIFYAIEAEDQI